MASWAIRKSGDSPHGNEPLIHTICPVLIAIEISHQSPGVKLCRGRLIYYERYFKSTQVLIETEKGCVLYFLLVRDYFNQHNGKLNVQSVKTNCPIDFQLVCSIIPSTLRYVCTVTHIALSQSNKYYCSS